MRLGFGRALGGLLGAAALASACGSRSNFAGLDATDARMPIEAHVSRGGRTTGAGSGGMGVTERDAASGGGGRLDASPGDANSTSPGSSDSGAVRRDGSSSSDGSAEASRDASAHRSRDASAEAQTKDAADALTTPDCACPPLEFFLDTSFDGVSVHLTAPYPLGIYCEETAVQLAHPACGEVYRLSACNGSGFAPPCFYMGVDFAHGFLLGHFIDPAARTWDIVDGTIAPDAPTGRVGTGTFTATLRSRTDGTELSLSGSFSACLPRMPACVE
jgi:hypothetical protein